MTLHAEIQKRTEQLLAEELSMFEVNSAQWSEHYAGKFVLLGKQCFAGFHSTYEEAMRAGIRAFGPVQPFLIRQVPRGPNESQHRI